MNIKYYYELENILNNIENECIINLCDSSKYEKLRILSFLNGYLYKSGKLVKINKDEYKIII